MAFPLLTNTFSEADSSKPYERYTTPASGRIVGQRAGLAACVP
ncbi:hypothetical protein [Nonomuraea turkmeniaca]|nr:hypothetical protein [Nonomuraea turkmeniaca]